MIELDGGGVTGYIAYYAMLFALVGSTLLIFIQLWRSKRLDMDEDAKFQMMSSDDVFVTGGTSKVGGSNERT